MKKTLLAAMHLPVVALLIAAAPSCKKKEEDVPIPMPSASAVPTAAPTPTPAPVVIAERRRGRPKRACNSPRGPAKPADVAGLRACCTALKQNAASMPPEQAPYALQAATMCEGMVSAMATGSMSKAGALGMLGATLKGAHLPLRL